MSIKAFTDYPIIELGDIQNVEAPIRACEIISYDRNKYVYVKVDGVITSFKSGYCYSEPGRIGDVPHVSRELLLTLPDSNPI